MSNLEQFAKLGISEKTLEMLAKKGFEEPSPIQSMAIPLLLQENINIIGQAQTGTGKTAAFGIPLAEKITEHQNFVQSIILVPTRELAIQVTEEIQSFLHNKDINVLTIYGGQSYTLQLKGLKRGADIVVGTPGRVIDHIDKGTLKLDKIKYLILDEADEMLNMGFIDDIKKILSHTKEDKSMLLFSATMPKEIITVAKKYMGNYQTISVKKDQLTTTQVDQIYFEVNSRDKFEALCRIIDMEPDFFGIIFCKTKVDVDFVASRLKQRGYDTEAIHGDIEQKQRERILRDFKGRKTNALVATDVAARGIDVNDVTHVINYTLPGDAESYIHRIGRTGRAGKQGIAITFITPSEYKRLLLYKKLTKTDIKQGKIPNAKDVITAKKSKLIEDMNAIINAEGYKYQLDFAKEILQKMDPETAVATFLTLEYNQDFNEDKYGNISEVNINKSGKTRLFIALGKTHGYTPRSLIDYITEKTQISGHNIDELRMLDDFSFISTSFEDAELILHVFEKIRESGQRSLVSKAKDKGETNSRQDSRQDSRPRRSNNIGREGSNSRERSGGRESNYAKSKDFSRDFSKKKDDFKGKSKDDFRGKSRDSSKDNSKNNTRYKDKKSFR